jgi:hypothetical protein
MKLYIQNVKSEISSHLKSKDSKDKIVDIELCYDTEIMKAIKSIYKFIEI